MKLDDSVCARGEEKYGENNRKVTSIGERAFENSKYLLIKTPCNLYALEYAKEHGIGYEDV